MQTHAPRESEGYQSHQAGDEVESLQTATADGPELERHRCLVVVHGIGTQARGSTLTDIGEPLTAFLKNSYSGSYLVDSNVDLSPAEQSGAHSETRFNVYPGVEPGTPGALRLNIREAWWAQRFLRPDPGSVLLWTFRVYVAQLHSIHAGILRATQSAKTNGQPADEPAYEGDDKNVYSAPDATSGSKLYDLVMGRILWAAFLLGGPIVFLLLLVVWALEGIINLVSSTAATQVAQKLLSVVFVDRIAEVCLYLTTDQVRASIRGAVTTAIRPSLDPRHKNCEGLIIIAHSWGAVVVLDSLLHLVTSGQKIVQRSLTFMTVGAGLNRAWEMENQDPLWQQLGLLAPWLPKVRWINIWARYDPLAAGPLDQGLRKHLADHGAKVYERRVVIQDDLLADHTSYWSNCPEVISRFAYEIIQVNDKSVPLYVRQSVIDAASTQRQAVRRRTVGQLAFLRMLFYVLVLLLASMYFWGKGDPQNSSGANLLNVQIVRGLPNVVVRTSAVSTAARHLGGDIVAWIGLAELIFVLLLVVFGLVMSRGWFTRAAVASVLVLVIVEVLLIALGPEDVRELEFLPGWVALATRWQEILFALALLLVIYKFVWRKVFLPQLDDEMLQSDSYGSSSNQRGSK